MTKIFAKQNKLVEKFSLTIPKILEPEDHEIAAALILMKFGDVEFLIPNRTKNARTADVIWLGKFWEIKSPQGEGKRVLINTIRGALRQSPNIILDLRRLKISDEKIVTQIRAHKKNLLRGVNELKIITKEDELVDIK